MEDSELFGRIARPVAEVSLRSKTVPWIQTFMYIDSGADISVIPRQVGEALELNFSRDRVRNIRGIGKGTIPVIMADLEIKVGEKVLKSQVAWASNEDIPLILGRRDVFDAFKISFDQRQRTVTFTD